MNDTWNAEPNMPNPCIEIIGADIKLSFLLNAFQYTQFSEGDIGIIRFHKCFQYRMGMPNDEGFHIYGQSRYKKYAVEWGHFYLVKDSDWEVNFPEAKIINSYISIENLRHYLFYFRDETFEVVAENYSFQVVKTTKYPMH